MSKLDSFDNSKKKCKICSKYFDKNLFSLLGCCGKCHLKKMDLFNRQTGKSALSYNLRYRPELFQNEENEQQT